MDLIVVSSVKYYRHLAQSRVTPEDRVLEIGCSTGETTLILSNLCQSLVAIDTAENMVDAAKERVNGKSRVDVLHIDGRDLKSIQKVIPDPTVLFLDIGGALSVDKVTAFLRTFLKAFRPRLIVIRNNELAAITSMVREVEAPKESVLLSEKQLKPIDRRRMALQNLLDLSDSHIINHRVYAARKLKELRSEPVAMERLKEMRRDPSPSVRRVLTTFFKDRTSKE